MMTKVPGSVFWYTVCVGDSVRYRAEAVTLLLSLIHHRTERTRVGVVTDAASAFRWMEPLGVIVIEFDAARRDEFARRQVPGSKSFFFHTRLSIGEWVGRGFGASAMLDTDCMARASLGACEEHLLTGGVLMHRRECRLSNHAQWSWRAPRNRRALKAVVGPNSSPWMWNAGVQGVPESGFELFAKARSRLDAMMGLQVNCWTMEQVALSLVFAETG